MRRKNTILLVLVLLFSFLLTACGDSSRSESSATGNAMSAEEQESSESEKESTDTYDKNILIAYFSETGNTEEAAQQIAEYTGGDLAKIERTEEYGDLYEAAEAEILDGVHPEIL